MESKKKLFIRENIERATGENFIDGGLIGNEKGKNNDAKKKKKSRPLKLLLKAHVTWEFLTIVFITWSARFNTNAKRDKILYRAYKIVRPPLKQKRGRKKMSS